MSTFVWILLAALYVTLLVALGLTTLRKGHSVLFILGFILPVLWIFGAMLEPTPEAAAAESRASLPRGRRA